jgi:hypothetical protein
MTILNDYYQDGIPNGWSPLGGQTKSPSGPDQDPSGSSTGSAVALVAGSTPAVLGAETMGSIVSLVDAYDVRLTPIDQSFSRQRDLGSEANAWQCK